MPTYTTYTPIIVMNVSTLEQNFKEFVVEIREEDNHDAFVSKVSEGEFVNGAWEMRSVVFEHTVKGTVYEHRVSVRDIRGTLSVATDWATETAGDTSYGSASWTNTLTADSKGIVVSIDHTNKPIDFSRVQIYVQSSAGLTDPDASWDKDYELNSPIFRWQYSGVREVTKYFYCRAFDNSGNFSALEEIGSALIPRISWSADMDNTPPDSTVGSGAMESA